MEEVDPSLGSINFKKVSTLVGNRLINSLRNNIVITTILGMAIITGVRLQKVPTGKDWTDWLGKDPAVSQSDNYQRTASGWVEGSKYAVVWGIPGQKVGTLGKTKTVDEVIEASKNWQEEVKNESGVDSKFVAVPRLNKGFSWSEMKELIGKVKDEKMDGLVIPDVEGKLGDAYKAVDELTPHGVDGIAFDLEFSGRTSFEQLRELEKYMAQARQKAGLQGDGILLLWHFSDKFIKPDEIGLNNVAGIKVVTIFDGFGTDEEKNVGVKRIQQIFGLPESQVGWMAFDNRWPINYRGLAANIRNGFDNQKWTENLAHPTLAASNWWAQQ
jgi:hypothetical protein